jgi:AcrR family transcriptional regulator
MAVTTPERRRPGRPARLSRELVLQASLAIADADGLAALTMQRVGRALGAEPMSLYRHVRNKDDLLDGVIDLIYAEIAVPAPDEAWHPAMRRRAVSAREVLRRHPWAVALMESRARPGQANLAHHEAVVANLIGAGFTAASATRAYNLIDSFVYGFTLQEAALPFSSPEELAEMGPDMVVGASPGEYPHLEAIAVALIGSGFRYADEFEPGLDLILDAIARERASQDGAP